MTSTTRLKTAHLGFASRLVCVSLVLALLAGLASSQSRVPSPSWTQPLPRDTGYLPVEYTGIHEAQVRMQMPQIGFSRAVALKIDIWSTPRSGVLALKDRRESSSSKIGWDTGRDRVHALVLRSSGLDFPLIYDALLWDDDANRSEVVRLVVDSSFEVTQSPPIAISEVGEIWSACGVVGSSLYVHDLSSHAVKRLVDADEDGIFELKDPSFSVAVPLSFTADGSLDSDIAIRFSRLCSIDVPRSPGTLARLNMSDARCPFDLVEIAGTAFLQFPSGSPSSKPRLEIVGSLVEGQTRLLVVGTPNTALEIHNRNARGVETRVSTEVKTSSDGAVFVDLTEALEIGSSVFAQATSGDHRSKSRTADLERPSTLLCPLENRLDEGSTYEFFGERLGAGMQAFCVLEDGTAIPLATEPLGTTRRVAITMPDLGLKGVAGPCNKIAFVEILMKDLASRKAVTQALRVPLFHR